MCLSHWQQQQGKLTSVATLLMDLWLGLQASFLCIIGSVQLWVPHWPARPVVHISTCRPLPSMVKPDNDGGHYTLMTEAQEEANLTLTYDHSANMSG